MFVLRSRVFHWLKVLSNSPKLFLYFSYFSPWIVLCKLFDGHDVMYWVIFIHTYLPTFLPGWLAVCCEIFKHAREEKKYLSWIAFFLTFRSCFVTGTFARSLLGLNWIIASHDCIEIILIRFTVPKKPKTSYCILVLFIVCIMLIGRQILTGCYEII